MQPRPDKTLRLAGIGLLLAAAGLAAWLQARQPPDSEAPVSDYRMPVTDPLPEPNRPDLFGEPRIDPPADTASETNPDSRRE